MAGKSFTDSMDKTYAEKKARKREAQKDSGRKEDEVPQKHPRELTSKTETQITLVQPKVVTSGDQGSDMHIDVMVEEINI